MSRGRGRGRGKRKSLCFVGLVVGLRARMGGESHAPIHMELVNSAFSPLTFDSFLRTLSVSYPSNIRPTIV
jgi:hypothetical protein